MHRASLQYLHVLDQQTQGCRLDVRINVAVESIVELTCMQRLVDCHSIKTLATLHSCVMRAGMSKVRQEVTER